MESIKNDNRALDKTAKKFGLDFLVLFGSQVNGFANRQSDFDIGYSADHEIDIATENEISEILKKEFSNPKVDLINLRRTSPLLAKKAMLEGRLLTENTPHSFAIGQMRAYHNYVETKALRQLYD